MHPSPTISSHVKREPWAYEPEQSGGSLFLCSPHPVRQIIQGSGTPTDAGTIAASFDAAPPSEPLAPIREARRGARLSAFHHGSCQWELSSQRRGYGPRLRGIERQSAVYKPPAPDPLPASTSRTGHSAGRSDARAARERSVWPRPQAPHSPRPPWSTLPGGVLGERDSMIDVTKSVTLVTSRLRYRDHHLFE